MNEPKFPVLHLEQNGDVFTLKRGKTPCSCFMKQPIPVQGTLGKLEMIGSPCSSTCPMFKIEAFGPGNHPEMRVFADLSLHCANQALKHRDLEIVQAQEPNKPQIIH